MSDFLYQSLDQSSGVMAACSSTLQVGDHCSVAIDRQLRKILETEWNTVEYLLSSYWLVHPLAYSFRSTLFSVFHSLFLRIISLGTNPIYLIFSYSPGNFQSILFLTLLVLYIELLCLSFYLQLSPVFP